MILKYFFLILFLSFNIYAKDNLDFANDLISQGDFFRALTVLKEIEFNHRGSPKGFNAQKRILQIHLEKKEFDGFDFQIQQTFKNYDSYLKKYNRDVIQAETYFLIGNHSKAFEDIITQDTNLEKKYLFRAYAETDRNLPDCESPHCESIKKIEKNISLARKEKSELLALGLGIIPGMGQVYAGNTSSGIATFVLNSFFIATSIIAFNNNEPAMGIASSLVGSTFYFSSIYAGYETARRYNSSKSLNEKRKLSNIPIHLNIMNIVFD